MAEVRGTREDATDAWRKEREAPCVVSRNLGFHPDPVAPVEEVGSRGEGGTSMKGWLDVLYGR